MKGYKDLLQNIVLNSRFQLPLSDGDLKLEIARELFKSHGFFPKDKDWKEYVSKLSYENKQKLEDLSHFYYFIFRSEYGQDTRDEIVLITISSVIEKIMDNGIEYLSFFDWWRMKLKSAKTGDKELIKKVENIDMKDSLKLLETEYFVQYGSNKRFKIFFNDYIGKNDQELLLDSVEVFDRNTKKFRKSKDITELATMIYQMRSDFVHKAEIQNFCPNLYSSIGTQIGKKICDFKLTAGVFVGIFEKAFINYFMQKD